MDWSYETEQSLVESHGLKIDEFDPCSEKTLTKYITHANNSFLDCERVSTIKRFNVYYFFV